MPRAILVFVALAAAIAAIFSAVNPSSHGLAAVRVVSQAPTQAFPSTVRPVLPTPIESSTSAVPTTSAPVPSKTFVSPKPVQHRITTSVASKPVLIPKPIVTSVTSTPAGRTRTMSVTSYCDTGTMADGKQTYVGAAAIYDRSVPFGTKIFVPGVGILTVEDHIGYGSDLDIYNPSCSGALDWGRKTLVVTFLD